MKEKVKVLVVAEPGRFRSELGVLLSTEPDVRVLGMVDPGSGTPVAARRLAPDVILLDLAGLESGQAELIGKLTRAAPSARVLALAGDDDCAAALPALAWGAHGLLARGLIGQERINAVKALSREGVFLPAAATRLLCERVRVR